MTNRQKALGVTEYGYQRGIKDGDFLANYEAFLAKAATIKKGQYLGVDILTDWERDNEMGWDASELAQAKLDDMKPFLHALTINEPDHFYYTDTFGLDCLTVK